MLFCCQYPLINYLDAYDVGAVVGLGVGGAAVGVDAAAGGHGDEIVLDAPAKAVEKNQCSAKY